MYKVIFPIFVDNKVQTVDHLPTIKQYTAETINRGKS
tara:strand:+ start:45870 stop:45980 length:111 start_codon:yes stop_codon:yes gene_type:complete